jgi:hypothetical protein
MGSEGDKVRTVRELIEEVEALHRRTDELIGHIAAQLDANFHSAEGPTQDRRKQKRQDRRPSGSK